VGRSTLVLLLAAVIAVAGVAARAADARTPASPLDGRWTFTWTRAELNRQRAFGVPAAHYLVEIGAGRIHVLVPRFPGAAGPPGRITTNGNIATIVFPPPAPPASVPWKKYEMRWSIYRDRLTWSLVPGHAGLGAFTITPWTRVR